MLEWFTKAKEGVPELKGETDCPGEIDATIKGLRSIAINVLLSAGYGVSQSWRHSTEEGSPGCNLTYIEAISIVVYNYLVAAVIPARFLCLPVMPTSLRKLGAAVYEFPARTKEMVEKERNSTSSLQNNMLSVIVKASDNEKNAVRKDVKSKLHLSEDEITGNLYQFTIAGFDTTANAMAYAVTILAIYPGWQDWIIEEIDQVSNLNGDLDYERTFPALKRCLALMVSCQFRQENMKLNNVFCSTKPCAFTPPWRTSRDPRQAHNKSPHLPRPSMSLQIRGYSSAAPPCM